MVSRIPLSSYAIHGSRSSTGSGVHQVLYRVAPNGLDAISLELFNDLIIVSQCAFCSTSILNPLDHEGCYIKGSKKYIIRWIFNRAKESLPDGTPCVAIITPPNEYWSLTQRLLKDNRRIKAAKRNFIEHSAKDPFTKADIKPLFQAQEGRCYYCGELLATDGLSAYVHHDHMLPIVHGGTHDVANIVLACRTCNLDKNGHFDAEAFSYQTSERLTPEQRKIVRRIQASVKRWKVERSRHKAKHSTHQE